MLDVFINIKTQIKLFCFIWLLIFLSDLDDEEDTLNKLIQQNQSDPNQKQDILAEESEDAVENNNEKVNEESMDDKDLPNKG